MTIAILVDGSTAGIGTYAGLQSALAAWLNRDDLTARIPDFVSLAEARFNRLIRVPAMEAFETLPASGETIALPNDFLELRSIYLNTDPRQTLEPMSPAQLRHFWAAQAVGRPRNFAIMDGRFVFGPAPDAPYDIEISYYQRIPQLSETNATNWLLTGHPDVYLYGALLQAEAYIWDDERLPLWKTALDEALEEVTISGNRRRYGSAPLRIRPSVVERL